MHEALTSHFAHLQLAGLARPRRLQPIDFLVLYGWLLKQPMPLSKCEVHQHWHPTWSLDEVDALLQELVRLSAVSRYSARMGLQHDTYSATALPSERSHALPKQLAIPKGGER